MVASFSLVHIVVQPSNIVNRLPYSKTMVDLLK